MCPGADGSPRDTLPAVVRALRWLPFSAGVAISMWVAAGAARGHKPFALDLTLTRESLALSLGKVPHYASMTLIFVAAVIAVGVRRPLAALGLTMLVGVGWEIAEATALGHTSRAADLAPDALAALACFAILLAVRAALERRQRATRPSQRTGSAATGTKVGDVG